MKSDIGLYDDGLKEYSISVIITENLALSIWILSGTLISMQFNSMAGWSYLVFALVMILFVLRKMLCTKCWYYGKRCHVGWGILAKLLFKKDKIEAFQTCTGQKAAPATYLILSLVPFILGMIQLFKNPSIPIVTLMTILIPAVIFSSVIARKNSCSTCKMKLICPGRADKK